MLRICSSSGFFVCVCVQVLYTFQSLFTHWHCKHNTCVTPDTKRHKHIPGTRKYFHLKRISSMTPLSRAMVKMFVFVLDFCDAVVFNKYACYSISSSFWCFFFWTWTFFFHSNSLSYKIQALPSYILIKPWAFMKSFAV